jgi:hypothetical protein
MVMAMMNEWASLQVDVVKPGGTFAGVSESD